MEQRPCPRRLRASGLTAEGEVARKDLERVGGGDGGLKALYEQLLRIMGDSGRRWRNPAALDVHHFEHSLERPLSGSQTWSRTVK